MSQEQHLLPTRIVDPRQFQNRAPQRGSRWPSRLGGSSLAVSVALFAAGVSLAADVPTIELPFQLEEHFIVIQGAIGELEDLRLIIDTGASSTTISRAVAKRLHLKGRKKQVLAYNSKVRVESVTLAELNIGGVRFEDVPAWVADLSGHDLRIDVLIGLDFLKRTNLSIDFESRKVRFGSVVHSDDSLPIYAGSPFVFLPVEVHGKRVRLMVDTGAGDLILFRQRVDGRIFMRKGRKKRGIRSAAGSATLRSVHLSQITVGATRLENLPAFLLEGPPPDNGLDGILGPASLGLKRLQLDFMQNRISWER